MRGLHTCMSCKRKSRREWHYPYSASSCAEAAANDVDAAVLTSYLSQIKELLPGYGDGFLASCLQARNLESVLNPRF